MQNRPLGKTTLHVSEIGFGTWGMGGMWGPRDDRGAINALVWAMNLGVNFIDTALVYGHGHSEALIASAFKEAKKRVPVATKIPPKNFVWPAKHNTQLAETFPKEHVIQCTEQSLKNLRTDCLDLQQFHVWSDAWLTNPDWFEAIALLKKQGKIRFFGLSLNDHEPDSALQAVSTGLVDTIQVIYNIFDQSPEKNLFPFCQKHKVGVIVRVPFDEGALTGTLSSDQVFHKKDWRSRYFTPERLAETCKRVSALSFLIRDEITTLSQASLKYCLSHPAVSTVIPGMRTLQHVKENCAVSDEVLLREKELTKLKAFAWSKNFYNKPEV